MTDTPHTVNAYGVDPNTIDAAHADRVARALGLPHAVRIGCGGFLHGISHGVLTITPEPFDLRNPRIVSVPWAMIERLGEAADERARLRAKPLEFEGQGDGEWIDRRMGFHILFADNEPDGEQYQASWGEADPVPCATLEDAMEACQGIADDFIRRNATPEGRSDG